MFIYGSFLTHPIISLIALTHKTPARDMPLIYPPLHYSCTSLYLFVHIISKQKKRAIVDYVGSFLYFS